MERVSWIFSSKLLIKLVEIWCTVGNGYSPDVIWNCSNLLNAEQESLENVNEFFFWIHILAALADQAEACLKVWKTCFKEGQNVGSLVHGAYSNSESVP